jgi:hypothetical protein
MDDVVKKSLHDIMPSQIPEEYWIPTFTPYTSPLF